MGFIDLFRSLEKYQAHDLTNIYLVYKEQFFQFRTQYYPLLYLEILTIPALFISQKIKGKGG